MKITDVKTHLLTALWKDDPWFPQCLFNTAVVRVETDSELDGLGEITLAYFSPESVEPIVDFFKPVLIGQDPFDISRLGRAMFDEAVFWARSGAGRSVISGLEMALWDLKGKALNVPVYQLLGGPVKDRIATYASGGISQWPMEDNIKKMASYADLGYRAVKISTDFYGSEQLRGSDSEGLGRVIRFELPFAQRVEKMAANFESLRREFGPDMDFAIDGHQGGTPNPDCITEALAIVDALAPYRLRFFEEPLAYTDVDGYIQLCARSPIPIAGGESLAGLDQFHNLIGRNGLHVIQPDVGFAGGMSETVRIIHHAEAYNISTAIHTGAAMGPAFAASWHLAAATQSVQWLECVVASESVKRDLILDNFDLADGFMPLPSSPGFGVHLTPELIEKYKFVPGTGERT